MAKKSNKTEHVLRLITKNEDDLQDDFFGMEQSADEKGAATALNAVQTPPEIVPEETEVSFKSKEAKEQQESARKAEQKPELKPEPEKKAEQKAELKAEDSKKPPETNNTESSFIQDNGHLINIAEILAKEKIALVMEKMKVCTCSTCFNDVLALTLNSLPTKYVTTDAGKQYFQLDMYKKQYETDVLAALTKSCVRVKASPRHL